MRRRWWTWAISLCLLSEAAASRASPGSSANDPGLGQFADDVFRNDYFGISYKLPPHWRAAESGPSPSDSGYYVLGSFVPRGELVATILIAAQDMFFARPPIDTAAQMASRFAQSLGASGAMSVDHPTELMIGNQRFSRVDFSGAGLHHAMFVTELRCHLVSFNLRSRDPKLLDDLVSSLTQIAFARDADASAPICIKDYANADNLLHRVEPEPTGPRFAPIPVRIVIGTGGLVGEVHVIRATQQQREAIETALRQWRFKPYRADRVALPVETGLLFSFGAAQEAFH